MYYLLYPAFAVSIFLIFLGIKWGISILRLKTIAKFQFDENHHEFTIDRPGRYSFNITGARWIDNEGEFKIGLKAPENAKKLELIRPYSSGISLEYVHFFVHTPGTYTLQCQNIEHLAAKESALITKRIFGKNIHPSKLGIEIKETISPIKKNGRNHFPYFRCECSSP